MNTTHPQHGDPSDPHATQSVLAAGTPIEKSDAAIVLIHGRGATPEDMLSLFQNLGIDGFTALAPQAANYTWYPHSFLAPLEANQPYLDSALTKIESIILHLLAQKISSHRIALLGFSQGACLTLEFAARHPRRYGAIIAFTGGLIGPPGTPRNYPGSFPATPILLASSDPDPHVPFERVEETKTILSQMGAQVELRRYPGMAHTINGDELNAARKYLRRILNPQSAPSNIPQTEDTL